jgi:hypothetical protein
MSPFCHRVVSGWSSLANAVSNLVFHCLELQAAAPFNAALATLIHRIGDGNKPASHLGNGDGLHIKMICLLVTAVLASPQVSVVRRHGSSPVNGTFLQPTFGLLAMNAAHPPTRKSG